MNIAEHKIGEIKDWKFGLVTREVERLSDDVFILNDMSGGWLQAEVNKEELTKLYKGELRLLDLDWE